MSVRKIFAVVAVVLLFAGSAFAFPRDPNPSVIQEVSGDIPGFGGFDGSWVSNFGSINANNLRLMNFLTKEFFALGGPGGAEDLKIWDTPSFSAERLAAQNTAWEYHLDNPGSSVPSTVARSWYTTHGEMLQFIEALPKTNLTIEYLGEIPRGFPFPFMVFSKGNSDRTPAGLVATGKPLVWIQGNIHGNEVTGPEGLLALTRDIATGKYDEYLDKVNVVFCPRVCADGAKGMRRESRDLQALQWTPQPEARDLNRDNMLLDLQVTRTMRKMFLAYGPHFCVDLHEWGGSGGNFNAGVEAVFGMRIDASGGDIAASGTTIIQSPRELTRLRYEYMHPDLAAMAPKYGIHFGLYSEGTDTIAHGNSNNYAAAWNMTGTGGWRPLPGDKWTEMKGPYADAAYGGPVNGTNRSSFVTNSAWDPDAPYYVIPEAYYNNRSSRNINSMPGVVSLLFENRVLYLGRTLWERRIATGYLCMLSTIKTAAEKGHEIVPKVLDIRSKFVDQGKTVSESDKVPILVVQPRPTYWTQGSDHVKDANGVNYLADFGYKGRDYGYSVVDIGLETIGNPRSIDTIVRYDMTKSLKNVGTGLGRPGTKDNAYVPVSDDSGTRDYQPIKFEQTWLGWAMRERVRPYAYIFEGPYANELATRMSIAGIEVKRLAKDVTIDVEGWKYLRTPYIDLANSGTSGWGGRDIDMYEIKNRTFKKDTFVVYLAQLSSNLIPMYMEPDLPWNVASCIFLPYMSVALGGPSTALLSPQLVGIEMPAYRYLKEVDLPTYDVNHFLPLVNRGAVARFFGYHTQEDTAAVVAATGMKNIKVYDYDFQVHTRTDALVGGRFDLTLPTSDKTKGYLVLSKAGYQNLIPHSATTGWNVATIVLADHGHAPFTIDTNSAGNPVVGDGSNRTLPHALPKNDDLIGVRIVEIVQIEIADLFKDGMLPSGAIETANGIKYVDLLSGKETILCEGMLDGWKITGVDPKSGTGWKAYFDNGKLIIKFDGDAFDQVVTVTLENAVTGELFSLEIEFSGEKESIWDRLLDRAGCNGGMAMLALFAIFPLFLRKDRD